MAQLAANGCRTMAQLAVNGCHTMAQLAANGCRTMAQTVAARWPDWQQTVVIEAPSNKLIMVWDYMLSRTKLMTWAFDHEDQNIVYHQLSWGDD